ncbi:MAG: PAS domain-containing protein [Caldilineaceae bacterium]
MDKPSSDLFQRLTDRAPDIVFRFETLPEMRCTYLNAAVYDILGYAPEEIYADPELFWRIIHPEDLEQLVQEFHNPSPQAPALRWQHKDGRTVWIEQHIVTYTDAEVGTPYAVEGIARDVTHQKQSESRTPSPRRDHIAESGDLTHGPGSKSAYALQQACAVLARFLARRKALWLSSTTIRRC